MNKENHIIESKDVGSLEDVLGLNDPLFQPEPKQDDKSESAKKTNKLLDKIEASLGHYSEVGGPDCPYIKTDDDAIRKIVEQIRTESNGGYIEHRP